MISIGKIITEMVYIVLFELVIVLFLWENILIMENQRNYYQRGEIYH